MQPDQTDNTPDDAPEEEASPEAPLDSSSPEPVDDGSTPEDAESEPEDTEPEGQPPPADNNAPASVDGSPAPNDPSQIQPNQTDPAQIANDLNNHDAEFQQDLAKGHIKPETYQSLFASKDTPAKVGTLFGLLLSGFGSGLSGQKNAVMEMMDNQIKNDFEAQKASNENAQNWLRLSQAHELQKVQIPEIQARTSASLAQKKNLDADTDLKASTSAINKARLGMVNDFQNTTDKLPPGPQKDNAQAVVNDTAAAVDAKNKEDNAKTGAILKARSDLRGNTAPVDNGVNIKKMNDLINKGRAAESLNAPAKFNSTDAANATKEAAELANNRATARIYDDSFKKLDQMFLAGKLNKNTRNAEMAALGARMAKETTGKFNAAEYAQQASAQFPSWDDWGKARPEKYSKTMEQLKANEAGTVTLDRFGLKTPFPYSTLPAKTKSDTTATTESTKSPSWTEGQKGTAKNKAGKVVPVIFRNGRLVAQ